MADKKKEFNLKAYGIFAVVIVAVILVVLTVFTFVTRYTGFDPEKVAVAYVDTIVEKGDGYNAYKNSVLSLDSKFGDFIRENYLYPVIYDGYKPGDDTDNFNGLDRDELKGDKTLNDDGTIKGQVIDEMYPFFENLINENNGFDNYDAIFTSYIAKLREVRKEKFGDEYFDDEIFFDCFEANLDTYGETLTGTDEEFDSNSGAQISEYKEGIYEKLYGEDYRINVEAVSSKDADLSVASASDKSGEISAVKVVTVSYEIKGSKGSSENTIDITVVKIGSTWYVENSLCDTSALYSFYK